MQFVLRATQLEGILTYLSLTWKAKPFKKEEKALFHCFFIVLCNCLLLQALWDVLLSKTIHIPPWCWSFQAVHCTAMMNSVFFFLIHHNLIYYSPNCSFFLHVLVCIKKGWCFFAFSVTSSGGGKRGTHTNKLHLGSIAGICFFASLSRTNRFTMLAQSVALYVAEMFPVSCVKPAQLSANSILTKHRPPPHLFLPRKTRLQQVLNIFLGFHQGQPF